MLPGNQQLLQPSTQHWMLCNVHRTAEQCRAFYLLVICWRFCIHIYWNWKWKYTSLYFVKWCRYDYGLFFRDDGWRSYYTKIFLGWLLLHVHHKAAAWISWSQHQHPDTAPTTARPRPGTSQPVSSNADSLECHTHGASGARLFGCLSVCCYLCQETCDRHAYLDIFLSIC